MRLYLINLIALIIAVSSLHLSHNSGISFNTEGTDSLSSLPFLDIDPIRNPSNKHTHEIEIITRSFQETADFAYSETLAAISFLYYLPIYSLVRAKEYFLLI